MACFIGTHTVTSEDIAPTAQVAVPQGELMVMEGSKEPNLVLATSALLTTQSMFSSHRVSHQFQLLVTLPYSLLLIHK